MQGDEHLQLPLNRWGGCVDPVRWTWICSCAEMILCLPQIGWIIDPNPTKPKVICFSCASVSVAPLEALCPPVWSEKGEKLTPWPLCSFGRISRNSCQSFGVSGCLCSPLAMPLLLWTFWVSHSLMQGCKMRLSIFALSWIILTKQLFSFHELCGVHSSYPDVIYFVNCVGNSVVKVSQGAYFYLWVLPSLQGIFKRWKSEGKCIAQITEHMGLVIWEQGWGVGFRPSLQQQYYWPQAIHQPSPKITGAAGKYIYSRLGLFLFAFWFRSLCAEALCLHSIHICKLLSRVRRDGNLAFH